MKIKSELIQLPIISTNTEPGQYELKIRMVGTKEECTQVRNYTNAFRYGETQSNWIDSK